jgi:hypothetical protein
MNPKARAIAFYLPQYHPIKKNDLFWGKGFTEWTNVTKAQPLFKGHVQPKLPADLGFYDLRVPEIREQQADLARQHGIEAFCYWHYWFGNGERALESVFEDVLKSNKPDFPFCLGWANESWTGRWHGLDDQILFEQTYPGIQDYTEHFYSILPAFKDHRYFKVNKKPLFLVYRPMQIPDLKNFTEIWQNLAIKEGFSDGLYFVGVHDNWNPADYGFSAYMDASLTSKSNKVRNSICKRFKRKLFNKKYPEFIDYNALVEENLQKSFNTEYLPLVVPNWDNTPRSGYKGRVFINDSVYLFAKWLKYATEQISSINYDERIVFIKSWNEWAEGNYLEPDQVHGKKHLEAIREIMYEN